MARLIGVFRVLDVETLASIRNRQLSESLRQNNGQVALRNFSPSTEINALEPDGCWAKHQYPPLTKKAVQIRERLS
jgi:hypothetical protein